MYYSTLIWNYTEHIEWYHVWWPWLTSKRVAWVCQRQLSLFQLSSAVTHNRISGGGCSVLHLQLSLTMFRAMSADSRHCTSMKSTSICRIHVLRSLPLGRRHWYMSVVSINSQTQAAWTGACSGSQRRTRPNTDMRRLWMRDMILLSLVWPSIAVFVTIPYIVYQVYIRRWQVMWKAAIDCSNTHVSQPYKRTDNLQHMPTLYSLSLVERLR